MLFPFFCKRHIFLLGKISITITKFCWLTIPIFLLSKLPTFVDEIPLLGIQKCSGCSLPPNFWGLRVCWANAMTLWGERQLGLPGFSSQHPTFCVIQPKWSVQKMAMACWKIFQLQLNVIFRATTVDSTSIEFLFGCAIAIFLIGVSSLWVFCSLNSW